MISLRKFVSIAALLAAFTFSVVPASLVLAQEAAQEAGAQEVATATDDPADGRATAFVASSGAEVESVPGGTLLIAAYGVAWAFVLMFVVRIGRLASHNAAELGELGRRINASDD